jgi:hypothetical protein
MASGRHGLTLVLSVFFVVWGLITHGTYAGSGDEPHYMMIAHSIAFDRDLDLTNNYRDPIVNTGALAPELHALPRDGRLRPVHDIGMPLAFAPYVRVAYPLAQWLGAHLPASVLRAGRLNTPLILRHLMSLAMAVLAGLLARELYLLLLNAGGTARQAFWWSLLFALSPPILSHAFLFFTEITSALITLLVFRRLTTGAITPAAAAITGALTGFLLLVHARNIGIAAGLTLIAILAARRRAIAPNALAMFLGALVLAAAARAGATYVMWGSVVTTPHAAIRAAGASDIVHDVFVRATGLLFDREYGLLAYAPMYLLAAAGLLIRWGTPATWHLRPATCAAIVLVSYLLPVLLPMTNIHGWTGGWAPAARFLVPVAALLWVSVYAMAIRASGVSAIVVNVLIALQIAINLYLWQYPKAFWNDGDGVTAFAWARWLPSWTDGSAWPFVLALAASGALVWVCSVYGTERLATDTHAFPSNEG